MSSTINQKEYLKRYLGVGKAPGEKKKKKKKDKDVVKAQRLKIIDDNIDEYNISKEIQVDIEAADEDAPQIVAVIDERPPSLQIDDKTNNPLWEPFGGETDVKPEIFMKVNSFQLKKPKVENISSSSISKSISKKKHERNRSPLQNNLEREIKRESITPPRTNKESKSSHRSQEHRNSDTSPPRNTKRKSPLREREIKMEPSDKYDSFSQTSKYSSNSPPRRRRNESSNEDISPPRKGRNGSSIEDISPARKSHTNNLKKTSSSRKRTHSDSDNSPPRTKHVSRNRKQANSDSDISPPRKSSSKRKHRDSDISPPRKSHTDKDVPKSSVTRKIEHKNSDSDISPPRKKDVSKKIKKEYDSDISPPRRSHTERGRKKSSSSKERMYLPNSDSDISPPRKGKTSESGEEKDEKYRSRKGERNVSPPRKHNQGDISPPRRQTNVSSTKMHKDEDISPPRKSNSSKSKKDGGSHSRWGNWSPDHEPDNAIKPDKTMSGKRAGLQSAKELSKELASLKKKEDQIFQNMSEEVSGRSAKTVVRGQKVVDPVEEAKRLQREKEMKEKYDRWGKGLKQVESEQQKMVDQMYEMSKPLARYADDEDLEKYLKEQEREGDPMLAYIRKKKKKKRVEAGIPDKPMYMGEFMPNRFGIRPGYRWDGVDRSNGYEKRWFEKFNAKKAQQEEAFKWSTEDM